MNTLFVRYSSEGKAYSDFSIEEEVKEILSGIESGEGPFYIHTSTENMIYYLRAMYSEENGNRDGVRYDICFLYNEHKLYCNKQGRLEHWPEGFSDLVDKCLDKLIEFF